ncbi:MAG: RecX family transcriptional regulator [Candidatus Gracilibacteria bacterium]
MSFESFRNYALNYYLRYYPSKKKFREKLLKKSGGDEKTVDEIIKSMENIIVEKLVIESKIRVYITRNKNLSYIKSKLFEKGFEKEQYEEILNNNYNLDETLLDADYIKRKILDYKNKGKSRNYIFQRLFERKQDKDLINESLDQIYTKEDELENIKLEYENLTSNYSESIGRTDKNKIIEKLIRKGFNYGEIKKVI